MFPSRPLIFLVRPKRFELLTPWFVARYSIQLSYERLEATHYTVRYSVCLGLFYGIEFFVLV